MNPAMLTVIIAVVEALAKIISQAIEGANEPAVANKIDLPTGFPDVDRERVAAVLRVASTKLNDAAASLEAARVKESER